MTSVLQIVQADARSFFSDLQKVKDKFSLQTYSRPWAGPSTSFFVLASFYYQLVENSPFSRPRKSCLWSFFCICDIFWPLCFSASASFKHDMKWLSTTSLLKVVEDQNRKSLLFISLLLIWTPEQNVFGEFLEVNCDLPGESIISSKKIVENANWIVPL